MTVGNVRFQSANIVAPQKQGMSIMQAQKEADVYALLADKAKSEGRTADAAVYQMQRALVLLQPNIVCH